MTVLRMSNLIGVLSCTHMHIFILLNRFIINWNSKRLQWNEEEKKTQNYLAWHYETLSILCCKMAMVCILHSNAVPKWGQKQSARINMKPNLVRLSLGTCWRKFYSLVIISWVHHHRRWIFFFFCCCWN